MTDDEIRAELEALLQQSVGSGETEWADGTPEGEELWRLTHPGTIAVETTYWDYRAQRVVARSESRVQRMPPVEASL